MQRRTLLAPLALLVGFLLLSPAGCGGGSLAQTCEGIEWQGRQCQALKGVEWAKAHDLPVHTVEGYYSLPEEER